MKNNGGIIYAALALALLVCAGFVLWGVLSKTNIYEERVNHKYEEEIMLKNEGLKTVVYVEGVKREDCVLQRGSSEITCDDTPLTPSKVLNSKNAKPTPEEEE